MRKEAFNDGICLHGAIVGIRFAFAGGCLATEKGGGRMDNPSKVQIWIINGQLLTNRPNAFAKSFDLPRTGSVDGLTRVSHRLAKMKPGQTRRSS